MNSRRGGRRSGSIPLCMVVSRKQTSRKVENWFILVITAGTFHDSSEMISHSCGLGTAGKWKNRQPGAELNFPGDSAVDSCAKAIRKSSGFPGGTPEAPRPAPWGPPQPLRAMGSSSHTTTLKNDP